MTTGSSGTIQPGTVLERSLSVWFANLVPFTLLAGILYSPLILYAFVVGLVGSRGIAAATFPLVQLVATVPLSNLLAGTVVYGVFQQLRGRHAEIGECLSVGLARLLPVIGVGILMALATFGGFMACVIPGVIIMCMLWVSVPAAVVEQTGVVDSLRRSANLTEGSRVTIFLIAFAIGVVIAVANFCVIAAIGAAAVAAPGKVPYAVELIVPILVGLPLATLQAVAAAVVYHDLRVLKEGVGIEDLARVFD